MHENFPLKPYNTFGIDVKAKSFASFSSLIELNELLNYASVPVSFILGGGSNLLLTEDVAGIVLKNEIKGIDHKKEDTDHVFVKVGAGENWHRFVMHCVGHNWAGVENLSLIPGNVGASPMQNIGAYGVEIKDVFEELTAFDLIENKIKIFNGADCEFGYRESVFKRKYKKRFVILDVTFRLDKIPTYHTSYGAINQQLEKMGVAELSIGAISTAVTQIRQAKLPDPAVIGNAGSFFKNPSVSTTVFDELKKTFPDIVGYANAEGSVKLAAGWLIEACGWKGYRKGDAGCYPRQALVLVNYGHASGSQLFALSEEIVQSVQKRFSVTLEREVNIF